MSKRSADGEPKPKEGQTLIPLSEALSTTTACLKKIGWNDESASIQAEIMCSAETCGNNQGLVKLLQPSLMAPAAGAGSPSIERDTPSSCVVNGNQSPGMLALTKAVDTACEKVMGGNGGVASIGVYNTSTSSGQLAFYGARVAKQGLVCIITANSPEFVAAKAGASATFGTNPLCFACPVEGSEPFVFDMATASVALFGVLSCKAAGKPLPDQSAYDKDGNWTTNVSDIHIGGGGGAISAFGGHKGVGLALMIELLCAALSGGAVLGQETKKTAKNWGHHVIVIDPTQHVDGFAARAASIIKTVADSHSEGVRIPGRSSDAIAASNKANGTLPVNSSVWDMILKTAKDGL